jgi:acetolactate synthase-1/2/3 large subunit
VIAAAAAGTRRPAKRCSASPKAGSCRRLRVPLPGPAGQPAPNYAGDVGIGINPKLAQRIADADLVIALGARLGEMTTGGYTLLAAPRPLQKLVHVHAGPEELGRVYAADLLLQSSMACAAKALDGLAAPATLPWTDWTRAAHADYEANLVAPPVEPLDLGAVVQTLQRLAPQDTVYTNGAGNYSGWLHRYCRYPGLARHGRTQLAPTAGAMGYGLPAAVAASLLYPQRTVVNIAGDGDFLMTGQELATATGYGATRLISIVVDNGTYGTIRMHQEREYPGASAAPTCSTRLRGARRAPTAGAPTRRDDRAVRAGVRAALDSGGRACCT